MSGGVVHAHDPWNGLPIPLQEGPAEQARASDPVGLLPVPSPIEDEHAGDALLLAGECPRVVCLSVQSAGLIRPVPRDEQLGDEAIEQPLVREGQGLVDDAPSPIWIDLGRVEGTADVRYARSRQAAIGRSLDNLGQRDFSPAPANQGAEDCLGDIGTWICLEQSRSTGGIVNRLSE